MPKKVKLNKNFDPTNSILGGFGEPPKDNTKQKQDVLSKKDESNKHNKDSNIENSLDKIENNEKELIYEEMHSSSNINSFKKETQSNDKMIVDQGKCANEEHFDESDMFEQA